MTVGLEYAKRGVGPVRGLPCVGGCGCNTDRMIDRDDDRGKVPLCVFCEDGVACPVAHRNHAVSIPVSAPPPATVAKIHHELRKKIRTTEGPVKQPSKKIRTTEGPVKQPNGQRICAGFDRPCANQLTKRSRTNLCGRCRARKHYREKHPDGERRDTTRTHVENKQRVPAAAGRVTIEVNEEQLNKLLLGWPLEDKARIANAWLAGRI
jgi:hypothetical protein